MLSVCHLFEGVARFIVSSTLHYGHDIPDSSHWRLDPLLSSDTMEIIQWNPLYTRTDKIKQLLDKPLAKKHLRVCYDRKDEWLNCAECEKCVRTMLPIDALGRLGEFETLNPKRPLHELVDGISHITTGGQYYYEEILRDFPDYEATENIKALIERSKNCYKNKKGLARIIAKIDQKILRPGQYRFN